MDTQKVTIRTIDGHPRIYVNDVELEYVVGYELKHHVSYGRPIFVVELLVSEVEVDAQAEVIRK